MSTGRLLVVGGLPAAGKTTLSRKIAAALGAVYLRIDSLEQGMRDGGITQPIDGAGYVAARAIAADNLALGRTVVAECVNPWMLTRDAWRAVAEERGADLFEVEIVCSDPAEHRRRVESRSSDVSGLVLPTWQDVLDRDYRPWERERIVVDTAWRHPDACAAEILDRVTGVPSMDEPYYRADLALVHDAACGFHADACAAGFLALLEPVRERRGLVLELGCGSGALTRHLVATGHRVIATDASPAMVALARARTPRAEEIRRLTLPDDPLPEADAIVAVGHVLSYLAGEQEVDRALAAIAKALRPGGVLAMDLCDLEWAAARRHMEPAALVRDEWALFTRYSAPAPNRFVREMTTFVRQDDGTWRRDDEQHENVLVDVSRIPSFLDRHGVDAKVAPSFGTEELPPGLVAIVGTKRVR